MIGARILRCDVQRFDLRHVTGKKNAFQRRPVENYTDADGDDDGDGDVAVIILLLLIITNYY